MKAFIVAILLIIVSNFYCQFEVIDHDSTIHFFVLHVDNNQDSILVGGLLETQKGIEIRNQNNWGTRELVTSDIPVSLFQYNDTTFWLLSQDGNVYLTENSFTSIDTTLTSPNFLTGIADILFINDSIGFITTDAAGYKQLFSTIDRGTNWIEYTSIPIGGQKLKFENDTIYLLSDGGLGFSHDNGLSWGILFNQISTNRTYRDLYKNQEKMIFVGQGFNGSINFGAIVVSNDYGQTFQEIDILGLNRIMDIEMVNDTLGYVVGQPQGQIEAIYKTIDGGYTWHPVGYVNDPTHFIRLHKIKCLDENNCYACGLYGTIMKTTNGGEPMLGISEINPVSNDNVTVYPNPSMDYITVISEKFINEISLYDYKGALVKQQNAKDFQTQIDISVLAKGFYLLKINTNDGIVIKKIEKL